jgi:hypothetical protein
VRALTAWLAAAAITDGPVLRRIWVPPAPPDGPPARPRLGTAPLTPRSTARIVQTRAAASGFGWLEFGGHSRKRGALTTGMTQRANAVQLKRLAGTRASTCSASSSSSATCSTTIRSAACCKPVSGAGYARGTPAHPPDVMPLTPAYRVRRLRRADLPMVAHWLWTAAVRRWWGLRRASTPCSPPICGSRGCGSGSWLTAGGHSPTRLARRLRAATALRTAEQGTVALMLYWRRPRGRPVRLSLDLRHFRLAMIIDGDPARDRAVLRPQRVQGGGTGGSESNRAPCNTIR